tara:strand:- start:83 stop:454 length:372 start_codon:yes stop_codon:yes gene_type:complete
MYASWIPEQSRNFCAYRAKIACQEPKNPMNCGRAVLHCPQLFIIGIKHSYDVLDVAGWVPVDSPAIGTPRSVGAERGVNQEVNPTPDDSGSNRCHRRWMQRYAFGLAETPKTQLAYANAPAKA